jgi:cytoskeleton protein RodZ
MESVGHKLREARTRLGLTLEQVSADTRIALKNLRAIESDDLSSINSPFFYRSYVRQFASVVKLDYETIASAVQQAAGTMPEPVLPGQEDAPVIHVRPMRPKRGGNLRWLRSLMSLSLVMAACTGAYALWEKSDGDWHALLADISAQVQSVKANLNSASQNRHAKLPASSPIPRAEGKKSATAQPARQVQRIDPAFHVQLAAVERSWLSIVADGKEVFSGVLDVPETKFLEGHDSARIRTGNAGGLECTFNGKQIGTLGPRGQVRTVIFTKDNYQVLPSTSEVSLNFFTRDVD